MQAPLTSPNPPGEHASDALIIAYAHRELSRRGGREVEAHLAVCPRCLSRLASYWTAAKQAGLTDRPSLRRRFFRTLGSALSFKLMWRLPVGAPAAVFIMTAILLPAGIAVQQWRQNTRLREAVVRDAQAQRAVNALATSIRGATAGYLDEVENTLPAELNSGSFHRVLTLGTLCIYGGRFDSAIAALERAQIIKPDHPEPYKLRAALYKIRGEHRRSIDALKTLLKWTPADQDTWNFLGWSYYEIGDYTNAADSYRQALRIKPDSPDAEFNLAQVEQRQGNEAKARQLLESAKQRLQAQIAEHPGFAMAYFHLAKIHAYQRNNEEAMKYLQTAIATDPEWAFWGRYEVFFRDIFKAYPQFGRSLGEVADIYANDKVNRMLVSLKRG